MSYILIFLEEAFICRTTVRLRCAQSKLYPAPPQHSPQLPSADAHTQSQIKIVLTSEGGFLDGAEGVGGEKCLKIGDFHRMGIITL
jgi:hypothetical protein